MVQPTDQEIAIAKMVCYSQFLREREVPRPCRATGEAPGLIRRQKERGESMGQNLYYVFLWEGMDEARQTTEQA